MSPASPRIRSAIAFFCVLGSPIAQAPRAAAQAGLQDVPAQASEQIPGEPPADLAATERDAQARIEFERGRSAYGKGRYRIAWGHFREAYVLSRRPQLLYNVGQAADRLGLSEDALTAFRMYLQALPEAENRAEVEARIQALEGAKADMQVPPAPAPMPPPTDPNEEERPTHEATSGAPPGDGNARVGAGAGDPAFEGHQPGRSGWYFRGALGLGATIDGWDDGSASGNITGGGFALDLAAGITLLPGMAVGGALYWNYAPGGSVSQDSFPSMDLDALRLVMIGPMVDWYLRPRRDGLHLQGALVLAALSADRARVASGTAVGTDTAAGVAIVGGAGWEFALTRDLAWGAAGRITLGRLSEGTTAHTLLNLSAVGTITWY
ncbi:MAG: hypothetical protein OXR73_00855 [Myxococcales bacterium]|nr:hypothetical protein [Myxococcales bacterium]